MLSITNNTKTAQQTFQIEWERVEKTTAQRAVNILRSKVTDGNKFTLIEYADHMSLNAKVTIEDCTPIYNLVNDALKEALLEDMKETILLYPIIEHDLDELYKSVEAINIEFCPNQSMIETWFDEKPYWIERGYGTL